jgi:hypothetical protein
MVSVTDPYGCIPGFLDRSRYYFFQVAPQLYSRGWVDPAPDPSGDIWRKNENWVIQFKFCCSDGDINKQDQYMPVKQHIV